MPKSGRLCGVEGRKVPRNSDAPRRPGGGYARVNAEYSVVGERSAGNYG
jgi:hypothetical protein